jgi:hypothetical protein
MLHVERPSQVRGIMFDTTAFVAAALILLHLGVIILAGANGHPWGAIAVFVFLGIGDISYLLYCLARRSSERELPASAASR